MFSLESLVAVVLSLQLHHCHCQSHHQLRSAPSHPFVFDLFFVNQKAAFPKRELALLKASGTSFNFFLRGKSIFFVLEQMFLSVSNDRQSTHLHSFTRNKTTTQCEAKKRLMVLQFKFKVVISQQDSPWCQMSDDG